MKSINNKRKNLLCWFGFHKWRIETVENHLSGPCEGQVQMLEHKRECVRCGQEPSAICITIEGQ